MSNSETWAVALIYLGFFGLVGAAIWMTGTAWPLWALILMPTIKTRQDSNDVGNGEQ